MPDTTKPAPSTKEWRANWNVRVGDKMFVPGEKVIGLDEDQAKALKESGAIKIWKEGEEATSMLPDAQDDAARQAKAEADQKAREESGNPGNLLPTADPPIVTGSGAAVKGAVPGPIPRETVIDQTTATKTTRR